MSLFDLSGRVALVTGGNGGIGLGMARGLAQAALPSPSPAATGPSRKPPPPSSHKLGAKTAVIVADVADEAQCRS